MTTSPLARQLIPLAKNHLDEQIGLTIPSIFALLAWRPIEEHGATLTSRIITTAV